MAAPPPTRHYWAMGNGPVSRPGAGLTGVVVGAGDRGYDAYTRLFLDEPETGRIVGVAEPDPGRRTRFADRYSVADAACYESWEDLFERPRWAAGSSLGHFLLLLAQQDRAIEEGRTPGWERRIDPNIDKCPRAPPIWLAG